MTEAYKKGVAIRRQVMGQEFVDQAFAKASDFSRPLQELISENAWGSVWCRGILGLKERSLITVAMLTALGRQHELAGHVRGARNNGATDDEIREVILHATVYCGFPLASEAMRTTENALAGLTPP